VNTSADLAAMADVGGRPHFWRGEDHRGIGLRAFGSTEYIMAP
jgi:hypothetical protein